MRILIISEHFQLRGSSVRLRWHQLASELVQRGHEVKMISLLTGSGKAGEKARQNSVSAIPSHIVQVKQYSASILSRSVSQALLAIKTLLQVVREKRPDVVVVSAPMLAIMPIGWMAGKILRCPVVLDLRDAWPELIDNWPDWDENGVSSRPFCSPNKLASQAILPLAKKFLEWIRAQADAVIVTNARLRRYLVENGIRRTAIIRHTPNPKFLEAQLPSPGQSSALHIVYLGNVGRAQKLATAIKASAIAKASGTAIQLRIIGTGAHAKALEQLISELNAPVQLYHRVEPEEVLQHYAWADTALVMLRDWPALRMTVPSKLYEIVAVGRHICASAAGEVSDLIQKYHLGHVVPPEDPYALAQLWTELANNRDLLIPSEQSRIWIQRITDSQMRADKLEQVLSLVTKK